LQSFLLRSLRSLIPCLLTIAAQRHAIGGFGILLPSWADREQIGGGSPGKESGKRMLSSESILSPSKSRNESVYPFENVGKM
jgi:hypothetical protein